jgi:hypothetical protein
MSSVTIGNIPPWLLRGYQLSKQQEEYLNQLRQKGCLWTSHGRRTGRSTAFALYAEERRKAEGRKIYWIDTHKYQPLTNEDVDWEALFFIDNNGRLPIVIDLIKNPGLRRAFEQTLRFDPPEEPLDKAMMEYDPFVAGMLAAGARREKIVEEFWSFTQEVASHILI